MCADAVPPAFEELFVCPDDGRERFYSGKVHLSEKSGRIVRGNQVEEYQPSAFSIGRRMPMVYESTIEQYNGPTAFMHCDPGTAGIRILWESGQSRRGMVCGWWVCGKSSGLLISVRGDVNGISMGDEAYCAHDLLCFTVEDATPKPSGRSIGASSFSPTRMSAMWWIVCSRL